MPRDSPSSYISPDVLDRPDFVRACAGRDLGQILAIAVKWGGPGFSVSHVARRCEMTVSQVSDYMKRGRQATKIEVFERVSDGLHIPGQILGMATRPWEKVTGAPAPADGRSAITVYPGRGSITRSQWNGIIADAHEHIWLYGMAEFGYATDEEVPYLLARAANQGCEVRILLLEPDHDGLSSIDQHEGSPTGTLRARILASLPRFERMRENCGDALRIRTYTSQPSVSLVRGDGQMIVTPYLGFQTGSNSPTFEVRKSSARKIFECYERHFDRAWDLSKDWTWPA
jgi:hypothetical protein